MNENIVTFQTVTLPDGRTAQLIVPELVKDLAVVDLNVVKRLAALLPNANIHQIKRQFKDQLDNCSNISEYVAVLRDELSFHETVNMIQTIKPEQVTEQMVAAYPSKQHAD